MSFSFLNGTLSLQPPLNVFILVFGRLLGIIFLSPLFLSTGFSWAMRVVFSFFLAFLLTFGLFSSLTGDPTDLSILYEIIVGYLIGLLFALLLEGLSLAANVIKTLIDLPQVPYPEGLSAWIFLSGCFLLLVADAHHFFLTLIAKTFIWLPPITVNTPPLFEAIRQPGFLLSFAPTLLLFPLFVFGLQVIFIWFVSRSFPGTYWPSLFKPFQIFTMLFATLVFLRELAANFPALMVFTSLELNRLLN